MSIKALSSGASSGVAPWAATTQYAVGAVTIYKGVVLQCVYAHTSGATFAQGYWRKLTPLRNDTIAGIAVPIGASNGTGTGYGLSNGTDTSATYRRWHKTPTGQKAHGLRLVYVNRSPSAGNPLQAVTVKASLEYAGQIPVFFRGQRSGVVDPGAVLVSDPIDVTLTDGLSFFTRTYVSVPASGKWALNYQPRATGEGGVIGSDLVDSGTVTENFGIHAFGPTLIVGNPSADSPPQSIIALVGDSILAGSGDTPGSEAGFGFRAFDASVATSTPPTCPVVNIALGGDVAASMGSPYASPRWSVIAACTHALLQYGINDVNGGATLATVQSTDLTCATSLAARGMKVVRTTILPSTGSTGPQNTVRVNFNNWVRDGAPIDATTKAAVAVGTSSNVLRSGENGHPYSSYTETADAVELSRDSGTWVPAYQGDGTHPSAAGHLALATFLQGAAQLAKFGL